MARNARIRIEAEDRTARAVRSARRNFETLANTVASTTAAMGLSTAGAIALVSAQTRLIAENQKLSVQLGVSTQSLTELAYAFGTEGVINLEQFTDTMQELNVRLGEAATTGGGALYDAFKLIGLSIEEVRKLKSDEMIYRLADAFAELEDKQLSQRLLEEVFGGESAKMATLMNKGSYAVRELVGQYRELNGVISNEEAEKVRAMAKAWSDVSVAIDGLAQSVAIYIAGPGKKLGEIVSQFFVDLRNLPENLIDAYKFKLAQMSIAKMQDSVESLTDKMREAMGGEGPGANNQDYINALQKRIDKYNVLIDKATQFRNETLDDPVNVEITEGKTAPARPKGMFTDDQMLAIDKANFEAGLEAFKTFVVDPMEAEAEANKRRAQEWADAWTSAADNFSSGVGNAFADAIVDQTSLGDALQATMRAVTKEVIGSLIKIGVQRVIQAALGQKLKAADTATSVAQAATLTSAYTPAAVASSVATSGGSAAAGSAAAAVAAAAIGSAILGQAHDGLDYVPRTGTYLLEKGERVVKKEDNKALMDGAMGNSYNFTIQAMDTQSGVEFLMKNEGAIIEMVQQRYESRGEKGGPIA